MTRRLTRAEYLLNRLHDAGGAGVDVDKLSADQHATLAQLVRNGTASISFGRAYRVPKVVRR